MKYVLFLMYIINMYINKYLLISCNLHSIIYYQKKNYIITKKYYNKMPLRKLYTECFFGVVFCN